VGVSDGSAFTVGPSEGSTLVVRSSEGSTVSVGVSEHTGEGRLLGSLEGSDEGVSLGSSEGKLVDGFSEGPPLGTTDVLGCLDGTFDGS
jgi:hypothetical protein